MTTSPLHDGILPGTISMSSYIWFLRGSAYELKHSLFLFFPSLKKIWLYLFYLNEYLSVYVYQACFFPYSFVFVFFSSACFIFYEVILYFTYFTSWAISPANFLGIFVVVVVIFDVFITSSNSIALSMCGFSISLCCLLFSILFT